MANLPKKGASMPRLLLHVEGVVVFVVAAATYGRLDYSWLAFILLFLTPDLAMVGYLANRRIGAVTYNAVHTYTIPLLLGLWGWWSDDSMALHLALIWLAHIGADRAVGYGLKYPTLFKDTHFNRV